MAGTCVITMHLLREEPEANWQRWLANTAMDATAQALLRRTVEPPSPNPLACIAFTNYYKFLLADTGEKVRLDKRREEEFLLEEVQALDPEIVLLQSAQFKHGPDELLRRLSECAQVLVADHPSVRGERRRAGRLIESIDSRPA